MDGQERTLDSSVRYGMMATGVEVVASTASSVVVTSPFVNPIGLPTSPPADPGLVRDGTVATMVGWTT